MSSLIVKAVRIDAVNPHPNADRLEIATIGGWQVIIQKDQYKAGDLVIYVPPDSILTQELSDKLNVTQYLSKQRVRAVRLRGEMSFGLAFTPDFEVTEGEDVAERLAITKYDPPEPMVKGESTKEHPLFYRYTDIENFRNFPNAFYNGEVVVVTEKIHGTNCRVGLITTDEGDEFVIGSHKVQRKLGVNSVYEMPLTDKMRELLLRLKNVDPNNHKSVIVYCEIYGPGVQDLTYGESEKKFRVFDIAINNEYIPYHSMEYFCKEYGIEIVPILYFGVFDVVHIRSLTEGNTTLGATHMREGVVIKPMLERYGVCGRVILKMISDEYLARKGGTEKH